MHSSLVRLQNTFGAFTTVAFIIVALIAASDLLAPRTPSGTIVTTNVQVVKGRAHYYSTEKKEYAIIKFSLDADLSSLFTWNTKQLFVYVSAEWPATSTIPSLPNNTAAAEAPMNQVIIWDAIITSPSSDHLANVGPATRKKLRKSAAGRPIDPSRGRLSLKNQRPKYQVNIPSGSVAGVKDVRLRLHYSVQPWVGMLTWDQNERDIGRWKRVEGGVGKPFTMPNTKEAMPL